MRRVSRCGCEGEQVWVCEEGEQVQVCEEGEQVCVCVVPR